MRRAIALLFLLAVVVGLAPLATPYDPEAQHRDVPFAPPTLVHLFAPGSWRPVWPYVVVPAIGSRVPIEFFASTTHEGMNDEAIVSTRLFAVAAPAHVFLLGSDRYGRDRLSRLLAGARISIGGGMLAASLAVVIGMLLGGAGGARGGVADRLVARAAELFLAIPWLYLLLAVRVALPLDLAPGRAVLFLACAIGLAGWARPALLVRAVVLAGRTRSYVDAARGAGASEWFVLRRHILPQALVVVVTQAALLAPQFTLAEMTLSFFGLGVSEPLASWGTLLADVSRDHLLEPTWYALTPVIAVMAIFIAFQHAADAVIASAAEVTA